MKDQETKKNWLQVIFLNFTISRNGLFPIHFDPQQAHFFILLDYGYTLSNAGELCQTYGTLIKTKEDCSAVFPLILDFVDNEAKDATDAVSWWYWLSFGSLYPKGCFYHLPNKKLYWNVHHKGNKNNNDLQVCTIWFSLFY